MRLFVDDALIAEQPLESDVEPAVGLMRRGGRRLELRAEARRWLRASRDGDGYFVEVKRGDALYGLWGGENDLAKALRDFLGGIDPALSLDPDCPLCRLIGAG